MTKSDRAWLIGGAIGAAIWIFAVLLAMALIPMEATRGGVVFVLLLVTAGAIALAIGMGAVWSRIEDSIEQRHSDAQEIRERLRIANNEYSRQGMALQALVKEMRAQTRSATAAQGALERGCS
jgi:Na+/melibiose symporter-like transporter